MTRSARPVVLLAVIAVLASCAAPGLDKAGGRQSRSPVVLTLANFNGNTGELDGFAAAVARLSAGTMRIDILYRWRSGQVSAETGLIGDVRAGKADLGVVGSRAWDSVGVGGFAALSAPFLIDSYALQDRVLRSPMIGQMLGSLGRLGLVGIGALPGPFRMPLARARPLLRPSDYAGLRIGVGQGSLVAEATFSTLGAIAVAFPAGGKITGLDGIEAQISAIQGNRYDKVGKYLTANVDLWPRPLVVFANSRTWATLTRAQRLILRQAVTGDLTAETQSLRDGERTDTAILCRRGLLRFVTASQADLAALRRAVQPVYDQIERDPQTRGYIRQIEAMRKGVPADPAPRCAHTARLAGQASSLDGVWRFTDTAAELAAAPGNSPADAVPENYGTWTLVLDRGRFAVTQEDQLACTWGYGTFTIRADRIEWLFTNGGGIAPTGANNKPGEFFIFGWSLYRGVLSLSPVAGAVSPSNFRVKPWALISAAPSARFLSKRCLPPADALPR
jgi:TRAP-type C4-dicarboxylate transport system substrate-binding protein